MIGGVLPNQKILSFYMKDNEYTPFQFVFYLYRKDKVSGFVKPMRAKKIKTSRETLRGRAERIVIKQKLPIRPEPDVQSQGLGLSSMKERASLSGGLFHVESAPGNGTTVRASWPLPVHSLSRPRKGTGEGNQ
jgi:glucose-6-phosphate-specific signal transduction histidine kinase